MGCINLDPRRNLEQYFSSPPPEHIHIVVQLPIGEYFSSSLHLPIIDDLPTRRLPSRGIQKASQISDSGGGWCTQEDTHW